MIFSSNLSRSLLKNTTYATFPQDLIFILIPTNVLIWNMADQFGNDYAVAIKCPEMRKRAYLKYCAHLAKGKSKRSFVFREGDVTCIYLTLEKYIKESPKDFDPIQIAAARAEGYLHWEQVVEDSATGVNEKANTASLQMKMRNKFDWDKRVETNQATQTEEFQEVSGKSKDLVNGSH
jgi:hypothetical protein